MRISPNIIMHASGVIYEWIAYYNITYTVGRAFCYCFSCALSRSTAAHGSRFCSSTYLVVFCKIEIQHLLYNRFLK